MLRVPSLQDMIRTRRWETSTSVNMKRRHVYVRAGDLASKKDVFWKFEEGVHGWDVEAANGR